MNDLKNVLITFHSIRLDLGKFSDELKIGKITSIYNT